MAHLLTSSTLSKAGSFLALSAAAILLSACGASDSKLKTFTSEAEISKSVANNAITEVIDQTIIPAANNFKLQAQTLASKNDVFCASGGITTANLTAAQNQWQATNVAWFELLPFLFGPMQNGILRPTYSFIDSYRVRGQDKTSDVRVKIKELLTATIEDNTFSSLNFQHTGLLALEVALFEDIATQSKDVITLINEYTSSQKCKILTGYSTELLRQATIIQQGWSADYRETGTSYRELLINNQLESVLSDETGDSAIKKVARSVQEYYDYLGKRAVTSSVAAISDSIWQTLEGSLQSTEKLLKGQAATKLSLNKIMENNKSAQTVVNVQDNINTMRSAVQEKNATDMIAAAKTIDGNFKRDIPDALNISLGLNFSDGD